LEGLVVWAVAIFLLIAFPLGIHTQYIEQKQRYATKELKKFGYDGNNLEEFSKKEQKKICELLRECPSEYYLEQLEKFNERPKG